MGVFKLSMRPDPTFQLDFGYRFTQEPTAFEVNISDDSTLQELKKACGWSVHANVLLRHNGTDLSAEISLREAGVKDGDQIDFVNKDNVFYYGGGTYMDM